MGEKQQDFNVVESVRSIRIPVFVINDRMPGGGMLEDVRETGHQVVQEQWNEFVGLLRGSGPAAGYEGLCMLRDNLEARREELSVDRDAWSGTDEDVLRKRTENMLDFRLSVLENVLYRYEVAGSVSTLTEAEAAELSSEPVPTAEDILEEFEKTGLDVCESWDLKKDLVEWAVKNVKPRPSPSTVERRLEEIGVWVKGKQGRDGSGLDETIQNMKDHTAAD